MDHAPDTSSPQSLHRVVVIGGGFGGVRVVQGLRNANVQVTLIDRRNFHLFQPLTYQIATGALSPGQVAYPLRALFKSAPNVRVLLAEVSGFDLAGRDVLLADVPEIGAPTSVPYDTLVVAAGSSYSYFGHDDWADIAPEVKSLESALTVRSRILSAFEQAELTVEESIRQEEMTFVIVGGGPTGVEVAGQIAELARDTLRRNFRNIDSRDARVLLIDAGDRLLSTFPPSLSAKAARSLERLGVEVMVNHMVVGVEPRAVTVAANGAEHQRIPTATTIWAAGVKASGLADELGRAAGAEVDRDGRVTVERDLTLPEHPEVMVLGDMVRVRDDRGGVVSLPGVAPVAIQQGQYAARLIRDRLENRSTPAFRYRDKGNLATIGRARAVADIRGLRLSGFLAWWVWLGVHLWYLIGFQNRLLVMIQWSISFFTHGRGARLVTEPPPKADEAIKTPGRAARAGAAASASRGRG
ncbi:MAG: NAD(P)/FAD-dependent oxidoreductase [Solirubrobacterales bacterium]|nr:NAD(P)/FAD-dependent oxidoreductase [Solirubrobacterales bacterium]